MVLICNGGCKDPKTEWMVKALRTKNEKYNSLNRLDEIIVTYKNEVAKEEANQKNSPIREQSMRK